MSLAPKASNIMKSAHLKIDLEPMNGQLAE
jgi:hypothetical protein